jgi:hypothetical protein
VHGRRVCTTLCHQTTSIADDRDWADDEGREHIALKRPLARRGGGDGAGTSRTDSRVPDDQETGDDPANEKEKEKRTADFVINEVKRAVKNDLSPSLKSSFIPKFRMKPPTITGPQMAQLYPDADEAGLVSSASARSSASSSTRDESRGMATTTTTRTTDQHMEHDGDWDAVQEQDDLEFLINEMRSNGELSTRGLAELREGQSESLTREDIFSHLGADGVDDWGDGVLDLHGEDLQHDDDLQEIYEEANPRANDDDDDDHDDDDDNDNDSNV